MGFATENHVVFEVSPALRERQEVVQLQAVTFTTALPSRVDEGATAAVPREDGTTHGGGYVPTSLHANPASGVTGRSSV